jgi:hypothetical protein
MSKFGHKSPKKKATTNKTRETHYFNLFGRVWLVSLRKGMNFLKA